MTTSLSCGKEANAFKMYSLGTGTSVAITGTWQAAPARKEQPYELKAMAVKIFGTTDAEVGKKQRFDLQYLRCGF